jgi:hypothetical protein
MFAAFIVRVASAGHYEVSALKKLEIPFFFYYF